MSEDVRVIEYVACSHTNSFIWGALEGGALLSSQIKEKASPLAVGPECGGDRP